MAIKEIMQRFSKHIETKENHSDEQLRTHFYKGNFNELFKKVEEMFRQDADCRIMTVSQERGEIAVEITKPIPCFLVVTLISLKPLENAVDFTISTEKGSILGSYPILRKRILSFYDKIDQLHTSKRK